MATDDLVFKIRALPSLDTVFTHRRGDFRLIRDTMLKAVLEPDLGHYTNALSEVLPGFTAAFVADNELFAHWDFGGLSFTTYVSSVPHVLRNSPMAQNYTLAHAPRAKDSEGKLIPDPFYS